MFVCGNSHKVIKNDVVHRLSNFSVIAFGVLRFPGGVEHGVEDFLQARVLRVARMEFHEPRRAFRTEKKLQRVLRRRFRWSQRVKRRAGMNLKVFAPSFVSRWTRR